MDHFGKDVSASMLGFSSLSGMNSRSKSEFNFAGVKPKSFSRVTISPGMTLTVLLPEFSLSSREVYRALSILVSCNESTSVPVSSL